MRFLTRFSIVGLIAALVSPAKGDVSLLAQETFDVGASLECFEAVSLATTRRCPPGTLGVSAVLERPDKYDSQKIRELLEGLTGLAMHHDSSIVRVSATTRLMAVGTSTFRSRGSLPANHRLVEQVLRNTVDPGVRLSIIRWAPRQQDTTWGLELLTAFATEDDGHEQHPPFSFQAIQEMRRMGGAGRSRINELVAQGRIRNPVALEAAERAGMAP